MTTIPPHVLPYHHYDEQLYRYRPSQSDVALICSNHVPVRFQQSWNTVACNTIFIYLFSTPSKHPVYQ